MLSLVLTVAASYLLGSIPFGYLLVRIFRGEDVRVSGSGNIGASNVARTSPVLGVLTLLLDALKGFAAVVIAIRLSPQLPADISLLAVMRHATPLASMPPASVHAALAALVSVLGHMFPVWLNFRGGKGVATGLGSFVVIAPLAIAIAVAIFVILVALFHYSSLGSIVAAAALPVLSWMLNEYGHSPLALALMALTSLLIIAKHHENIGRLIAGKENRVGPKRT